LSTERHLSAGSATGYLLMVIVGSFAGYLSCAWLTDAIGRRRGFICFALCAAALTLLYTQMPISGGMLLMGLLLGFFGLGIFSSIGAFMSELYPSEVRGSGAGFSYSVGRGIGGLCPLLIGKLSGHISLGDAICGFAIGAYGLVVVSAFALPETRGSKLTEVAPDAEAAHI
jgi:MFS family permease